MSNKGNSKSSDEILHELFDSLNLPNSSKNSEKVLEKSQKKKYFNSSDDSDNEYSNSSSTDQEIFKLLEETENLGDEKILTDALTFKKDKKKQKKKLKKEHDRSKKKKKKKSHKGKYSSESDSEVKHCKSSITPEKRKSIDEDVERNAKCKKSRSFSKSRSRSYSPSPSRLHKKSYARSRSKSKSKSSRSRYSSSKSKHYRSRSRSRSISGRNWSHKARQRYSHSLSRTPSPRKHKKSKSRSRSPIKNDSDDALEIWRTAKLASLKKHSEANKIDAEKNINISKVNDKKDNVIESIPLPITSKDLETKVRPNDIPLPSLNSETEQQNADLDLKEIPIPLAEDNVLPSSRDDIEPSFSHDDIEPYDKTSTDSESKLIELAKEEGKGKTIVIKNLKDSIVLQQATQVQDKSELDGDKDKLETSVAKPVKPVISDSTDSDSSCDKSLPKKEGNVSVVDVKSPQDKKVMEFEIGYEEETRKGLEGNESKDERKKANNVEVVQKDKKRMVDKKYRHRSTSRSKYRSRSRSGGRSWSKNRTRKRSRSNSRSRRKSRSNSRSRKRSNSRSRPRRRSGSKSKFWRKSSRSGSRSKAGSWRYKGRKRSRSRSISSSRSRSSKWTRRSSSRELKRSPDCVDSLRDKATRKRLLEVARKNAVYLMKNNCLPPSIENESVKATGKSVEELTSFCQQLVAKNYSDSDLSDPSLSPDEQEGQYDKPFSSGRHPFAIKDNKPILMNIRNAPMLPTKTNAERLADTSKLREQFPVSSGSQHRTVAENDWVPVEKDDAKKEVSVFPDAKAGEVDISQLMTTRLNAMRRLQANPTDREAMKALNSAQKEMQDWALSKQKPGQFTGSTGARILSQEELSSGYQAWAKKEQFKQANPVSSHFGMKMLQKMGWNPGEGLGKNKEGALEPLLLDVKMDKKGLTAQQEMTPRRTPIPLVRSLAGKHPVSALVEICSKRKWQPPEFEIVFDCGPDHKKNFLMKVHVNNQTYKPAIAASTKKIAKANAAAACLQALGVIPKDPVPKPQGTLTTNSQPEQPGQSGQLAQSGQAGKMVQSGESEQLGQSEQPASSTGTPATTPLPQDGKIFAQPQDASHPMISPNNEPQEQSDFVGSEQSQDHFQTQSYDPSLSVSQQGTVMGPSINGSTSSHTNSQGEQLSSENDVQQYSMPENDTQQYSVTDNDDIQEYSMTGNDTQQYSMVGNDTHDYSMTENDAQEYSMAGNDTQEYSVTGNDTPEYSVAENDTQEYSMTGNDTPEYSMTVNDAQEYSVTGNDAQEYSMTGNDAQDYSMTGNDTPEYSVTGNETQEYSMTGNDMQQYSMTGNDMQQYSMTGNDTQQYSMNSQQRINTQQNMSSQYSRYMNSQHQYMGAQQYMNSQQQHMGSQRMDSQQKGSQHRDSQQRMDSQHHGDQQGDQQHVGSQPVAYPTPMGSLYGGSNAYSGATQYDQMNYYGNTSTRQQ